MKKVFVLMIMVLLLGVFTVNVYADPPSTKTQILQWDENGDADGYIIGILDRTANPTGIWPVSAFSPPTDTEKIMVMDVKKVLAMPIKEIMINGAPLKDAVAYEFRVMAYNACGNTSEWSDKVDYTLPANIPALIPLNFRKEVKSVPITIIININGETVNLAGSPGGE